MNMKERKAKGSEFFCHGDFTRIITILVWIIFGFTFLSTAVLAYGKFEMQRDYGKFISCQSNCKNIGTALEMWSTDNRGHYPKSLKQITPNYLKAIPTCPAAGKDTYSSSYAMTMQPRDFYSFCCKGKNHASLGIPADYPKYDSSKGITVPPLSGKAKKLEEERMKRNTFLYCKSNLKNIGTALELYSTDNKGHYPRSLKQICPLYLKTLPTCPAAGKDTYSSSYKVIVNPDAYTVFCSGHNHKNEGVPQNYPQYSSIQGLMEKP